MKAAQFLVADDKPEEFNTVTPPGPFHPEPDGHSPSGSLSNVPPPCILCVLRRELLLLAPTLLHRREQRENAPAGSEQAFALQDHPH